MNILHLTLKKKWFDMIERREKLEEYRELKGYWIRRIAEHWDTSDGEFVAKKYHAVTFRNGYSRSARTMTFLISEITIGEGCEEWGADPGKSYFRIALDQRIYR